MLMTIIKVIFAILVCLPIAALFAYLFEKTTEDAKEGAHARPARSKRTGILGLFAGKHKESERKEE